MESLLYCRHYWEFLLTVPSSRREKPSVYLAIGSAGSRYKWMKGYTLPTSTGESQETDNYTRLGTSCRGWFLVGVNFVAVIGPQSLNPSQATANEATGKQRQTL